MSKDEDIEYAIEGATYDYDIETQKTKVLEQNSVSDMMQLIWRYGVEDETPIYNLMPYAEHLYKNRKDDERSFQAYLFCYLSECLKGTKYEIFPSTIDYFRFLEKKHFKYVLNILEEGASYNHKYCFKSLEQIYRDGIIIEKNLEKSKLYKDKADSVGVNIKVLDIRD